MAKVKYMCPDCRKFKSTDALNVVAHRVKFHPKPTLSTLLRCPSCKSADVILIGEAKHSQCFSCGHKFTWTDHAVAIEQQSSTLCQKTPSAAPQPKEQVGEREFEVHRTARHIRYWWGNAGLNLEEELRAMISRLATPEGKEQE